MKKVNKDPSCLHLIKDLIASIQLTQNLIEDAKRLFTLFHTMKKEENYVPTRICLYKNLHQKSSIILPTDSDSLVKEIKRIHLQSFVCWNFLHKNILNIDIALFGWKINADNTRLLTGLMGVSCLQVWWKSKKNMFKHYPRQKP